MAKDYYQILGVQRGATSEEISKSFKKLARKHHPDINPGDKKAEERFKEITEAYEVLSHPEKKKKYDTYGSADFEGFPGGGPGYTYTYTANPFERRGRTKYSGGFDMDDLGEIFGDIFGAGLGGMGGKKSRGFGAGSPISQKGKDFYFSMTLDFLEALKGVEKKIRLSNGAVLNVKVPPGISDGARIRLAGKGEPGIHGGEAGDLYLSSKVLNHPYFKRVDDDIEIVLPLSVSEALSGAKIKVPTVDGPVELKIPAGSQSGQKLRLKGRGAMNMKSKVRGDQFVILEIMVPTDIDSKTKDELVRLLKNKEGEPRSKLWS